MLVQRPSGASPVARLSSEELRVGRTRTGGGKLLWSVAWGSGVGNHRMGKNARFCSGCRTANAV